MNRILFPVALLTALFALGGCAAKTTGNPVNSSVANTADIQGEASLSADTGVAGPPPVERSTATLTTLDGSQLETVYFAYDSFTLLPAAQQVLERNARWLLSNSAVKVTIEGHCDERGSDEYNLALGERRAMAVKSYLTARGVAAEQLATLSYGEERPAVAGHDEASWAKNRRGTFR